MAGSTRSRKLEQPVSSSHHHGKRSRPTRRYTVNVRLLLITLAVLTVAVPCSYLWYRWQLRRTATQLLARAEALREERDWTLAASYYQRYLTIQPEDTDALVKLVETIAQAETNPARIPRVNSLLYQALGRAPERHDLRRMLAENLLRIGEFEEARSEARKLLDKSPENAPVARKVLALSQFVELRADDAAGLAAALPPLLAAAEALAGDVELVEITANALRDFPAAVELQGMDAATRADQLMDQLIQADPNSVPARLARYRYRSRFKLPNADADLKAALQQDPDNTEGLLLAAMNEGSTEDAEASLAQAETRLRRVMELAPRDARAYMALAMRLEQAGRRDEAIEVLRQGRAAASTSFDLELALANLQITADEFDEAAETLSQLESQRASQFVRLGTAERTQAENQLRLLRARLAIAQGAPRQAIPLLQSILATSEASLSGQRGGQVLQATAMLAQISGSIGRWDQASGYWRSLAEARPSDANIVVAAVDALLRSGEFQDAVAMIDNFTRLAPPSHDLLLQRVQTHLGLQLTRPAEARNWTEFEAALRAAKAEIEPRWDLLFAELNYLRTQPDGRRAAIAMLRANEETFAANVDFWRNAARMYHTLGEEEDTRRAIARHEPLAASTIEHSRLQVALLAADRQFDQADQMLAALEPSVGPEERLQVARMRIELLSAGGKQDEALALAKQLLEANTKDTGLLALAIDIALGVGDLKTAEIWEGWLRSATDNGPDARFLQARRQLLSFDQLDVAARQQLERQIREIRGERPRWFPILALAARCAQLQGDTRRALNDYQMAVEAGDRRPFTLQQVALLLYEFGLYDEAQQYLARLTSEQTANPFLDALAIELAVQQDQPEVALQLARESVERFPDDPVRPLYLADLLRRNGDEQQALEVVRQATERFAGDPRVWAAWMTSLVRTGQAEEARRSLTELEAQAALSPENRHLVAAQGYELLGEPAKARAQYELLLALQPADTAARMRYARLLTGSDPSAARAQLEAVIQREPNQRDARRELAVLLASTGQESDWNRARQLLESSAGESVVNASTNDRMRAMLLSRRGRTRAERLANCQAARRILQQRLETDAGEARELNQQLLAQILEQEADLSQDSTLLIAAHDQLRSVADTGPPSAEQLSRYIEFLLRRAGKTTESATADFEADSVADGQLPAEVRDNFLATAEARLADLQRLQTSADDGLSALLAALRAQLLQQQGRDEEALRVAGEFVEQLTGDGISSGNMAQRYLTAGRLYSTIGAHAEAESWYRKLMETSPGAYVLVVQALVEQDRRQDAADFCLEISGGQLTPEMATLLANVMTFGNEAHDEFAEARAAIAAAVEQYGDNVGLLQSEAVMRASRGEYEQAIALFRRVVQLEPNNVLALNNLATLLAETPNQRTEALQAIERAMDLAGRQAALLDTKGTIHFKLGDFAQAIACLEEATAGGASDARYYLHLAAAYQQAGRVDEAQQMLREARGFGLERFVLTEGDRQLLSALETQ